MGDAGALICLRERVMRHGEPSRALDGEIDAALFGGRAAHTFTRDTGGGRLRASYGAGVVFLHSDAEHNGGHVLACHHRTSGLYTGSIDEAIALVERVLPGWWWSVGFCRLTNDATIAPAGAKGIGLGDAIHAALGPDFRAPRMDELLDARPDLDAGIDVARVGGNVPLAIIEALLGALIALENSE